MAWNPLEFSKPYPIKPYRRPLKLAKKLAVPFVICGGAAVNHFFPERLAYCIDVFVSKGDFDLAKKSLKRHLAVDDYFSDDHYYGILKRGKQYLSLIGLEEDWLSIAIEDSLSNKHSVLNEPTLTFEWLILSKMWFGKRQDFMDCARLIARADSKQLESSVSLLDIWMPEAKDELRILYKIGKKEIHQHKGFHNTPTLFSYWHHQNASL